MSRVVAALAALLALAACQPSPSAGGGGRDVLRVAGQKGGTKALMIASGALAGAPYTVEWSEFPAAQPLLEAVGGGAADLGLSGDAPFLFAYQSGSPIKAVAAQSLPRYLPGALSILVPAASPVRSLADLKGRTVATTRGSIGHHLVLRALARAHLPPDWVKLTFLVPGDARAAFSSGSIDAWATWTPYAATALKEGARVVVDASGITRNYGFDVAGERALAERRPLIADFVRREARALEWAQTHQRAYATVLARDTGMPLDIALDVVVKNARLATPIDDRLLADQRAVLDDFRQAGSVTADRDIRAAFQPLPNTGEITAR